MFKSLTQICPNLSFTKSLVEESFEILVEDFPSLNDADEKTDWCETMASRMRVACRHLSQARCKTPQPKWLQHFDEPAAMSGSAASSGGVAEPAGPAGPAGTPEPAEPAPPEPAEPAAPAAPPAPEPAEPAPAEDTIIKK